MKNTLTNGWNQSWPLNSAKSFLQLALSAAAITTVVACGGGGGSSSPALYYPYETVYGRSCSTQTPRPGCTFNKDGTRVGVTQDLSYNRYGGGSNDMFYVIFDRNGNGEVYDYNDHFVGFKSASSFPGSINGTTVGVGITGLFWENVSNRTYWIGRDNVLYNANQWDANYGKAINNDSEEAVVGNNMAFLATDTNRKLVAEGAQRLTADYSIQREKALAIASSLQSWNYSAMNRGFTTESEMDETFRNVFGVEFNSALSAVKNLQIGQKGEIQQVTNRSASYLGLNPSQAQEFMKGMYKEALASNGYDVSQITW